MGWFFITVACLAALGLLRMGRDGRENRRYLEAARGDEPLQLDHLSVELRRFAADTRLLRISLESTVRTIAQFIKGDLEATNDDRDGFDQMLMSATRNLADWLHVAERLQESEQGQIVDGGANPGLVRAAMELEGWSFDRRNLRMPGRPPMNLRLQAVMDELQRVETALQRTTRIYR